ncbi:hypothetical protein [Nonomuraea salmonea]|uniref:hypothetical protein n=1 Tax=Nonomuraea salmonea TaxID=46181 RepID=UPI002FEBD670
MTDTSAPRGQQVEQREVVGDGLPRRGLVGDLLAEVVDADQQALAGQRADHAGDVVRDIAIDHVRGQRRGGDEPFGAPALGEGEHGLTEHEIHTNHSDRSA